MSQDKNICLSITSLAVGGAEKQCLLLANALKVVYDNVHVVVINEQPQYQGHLDFIKKENLKVTFLKGNSINRVSQYTQFLKDNKIGINLAYLPGDVLYTTISAKRAGVPYIIGGIRNARMSKGKAQVIKFLHNKYLNFSISNSHSGKEFFSESGFNPEKIKVIPNGIDLHPQFIQRKANKKELIITSVGRFVSQKDYHTALKSIAYLKKNHSLNHPFKYWIIGHGQDEILVRNWVVEYNLEAEVEIFISPKNIPELYEKSDIYLCTSTFEGLSNSVMEAMNFSLPVVATKVGDNDQLVQHEVNGYLVDMKNVEQIADSLQRLINDEKMRMTFGLASYQRISENYSYERFKNNYIEFLSNIAKYQ